jgi:hypothetical protein
VCADIAAGIVAERHAAASPALVDTQQRPIGAVASAGTLETSDSVNTVVITPTKRPEHDQGVPLPVLDTEMAKKRENDELQSGDSTGSVSTSGSVAGTPRSAGIGHFLDDCQGLGP